jgi:DNA-binding PadR family transcriptional regulator
MPADALQRKVLVSVAGSGEEGCSVRALVARYSRSARIRRKAVQQALSELEASGWITASEAGHAAWVRLTDSGRERFLELSFVGRGISSERYSGKSLHEAVTAHRIEIVRLREALERAQGGGFRGGAEGPAGLILSAAFEAARALPPAEGLIPIPEVRGRAGLSRAAFDDELWLLARAGRVRLHKINDEGSIDATLRRDAFYHPFTGHMLYFVRLLGS